MADYSPLFFVEKIVNAFLGGVLDEASFVALFESRFDVSGFLRSLASGTPWDVSWRGRPVCVGVCLYTCRPSGVWSRGWFWSTDACRKEFGGRSSLL